MSSMITIAGASGKLTINILGYENGDARDVDDANWLLCSIELTVDGFNARYRAALTTHELKDLEDELARILSEPGGSMSFVTDEENLGLKIRVESLGGVDIEGDCKVSGSPKVTLSFLFQSDQTFLAKSLEDIKVALQYFPIKEAI